MISIIIPTYNRAHFLPRAIKSVINQTYKDWELIIVDDGSTDNTEEIVSEFLYDKRIKYIKIENSGASQARNVGLKRAEGKYITFLDSDDEYLPDKIEKQYNLFQNSEVKNLGVVSCGRIDFKNGEKYFEWIPSKRGNILPLLLNKKRVGAGTPFLMIKNDIINEKGIYFDPMMPAGQDYDFLIRISFYYNFDFVNEPLVIVHHHNEDRVYNKKSIVAAMEYQFVKYKNIINCSTNTYSNFVYKMIDLFFVNDQYNKAIQTLTNEFSKLNFKKYFWRFYLYIFKHYSSFFSKIFLIILRKL